MKKLATAIIAALAFAAPLSHAQAPSSVDPKTAAAVKDLLETMKYRDTVVQMNAQMSAQLPSMILASATQAINANPKLSDAQRKKALDKVTAQMPEIVATVSQVMNDPQLIDEMIDAMPALYARHFTADEINEMGRFYKTPLGAKTMKVMPQLMAESMQLGQQLFLPRIQAMSERLVKDAGAKAAAGAK